MKGCRYSFLIVILVSYAVGLGAQAPAVELGTINFPTSAKPAAQGPFLIGVKGLYNFEFDIAADAFRESQKADRGGPRRESPRRQGARTRRGGRHAVRLRRQARARPRLLAGDGPHARQVS